ncbi:MAG: sigma-54-dependent Fis family transcriptional regulator [Planctomycetes bacterium]|nr:sigma-54-dependent Fis family transcriptional regulator [Planctomycetota bacterium]
MRREPILLVDDDEALRDTLAEALASLPLDITVVDSGQAALDALAEREFAVVVTDLVMKGLDGFDVLRDANERYPACRVLMLTGHGGREVAVRAMEAGASYYIEKPPDLAELRTKVLKCVDDYRQAIEFDELRQTVAREYGLEGIIGQDPKILRILDLIRQIAPTHASVLINGESGTGKELVARAIHNLSPRRGRPFVAINCGGMSEGTIESELFGHVKGSFTGAISDHQGKFEYANGGTILLDEVGEMPVGTQVKFLRVLEEREVARVGSNKTQPVDVRVLAATNADLEKKIEAGEFREDLYFRLKVVTIDMPPLRERPSDIKLLVEHFLRKFSEHHGKHVESIDRDALVAMVGYEWRGNVRELRNAVESMVVRARGNILTVNDLPPELGRPAPTDRDPWHWLAGKTAEDVERNHIRVTLELTGGNRVKAAKAMGISERTLYRRIREYGL